MKDKNVQIRNHILDLIENGQVKTGERLPGARKIAKELNSSFTHVQAVVESLVQCGVLNAVSRSGTYVAEDWQKRTLPYNFSLYSGDRVEILYQLADDISSKLGFRACRQFLYGFAELRVSHYLLSHYDEYLDLSDIFEELFGDGDDFFMNVMKEFYVNGKLCGIPFIFSPRVILYNIDLFKRFNCPLPRPHWTAEEFMETALRLREQMPPAHIFNWTPRLQNFASLFLRSGGRFFDPARCTSEFGTEKGLKGFDFLIKLRDLLGGVEVGADDYLKMFVNGEAAMFHTARQGLYQMRLLNSNVNACAVHLPHFPGGNDINLQAADLLCISRKCTDRNIARKLVAEALSEPIQDRLGQAQYGIPIRKSSAAKSLDLKSCYDSVFSEEIPRISAAYNIFDPTLYRFLNSGIRRICQLPHDRMVHEVRKLAEASELMIKIYDFERNEQL
jgi:DNA-binding transcriptional regulator YhcF (GntR family)